ncbi:MAG: 1-deoxy-D-xylulose-5-phosphate reductoisomerase [Clostridiales bacterium]|nr:1-deoxy-D-xylulose-5-phosphate reductoisomerase [Clostridiales bacterium]
MTNETKTITVLGATGSIGRQTLDVAERIGIGVRAIAAGRNVNAMEEAARRFHPAFAAMQDEDAAQALKERLRDTGIRVGGGEAAVLEAARMEADKTVAAIVGIAGLRPCLAAIEAGRDVALANKEALVCGGALVTAAAKRRNVRLIPVDSEHSAVYQCLQGHKNKKRILLTASGGPFFGRTRSELRSVTVEQALAHPNWRMGAKISIDSATMVNKGLELIEASWLFDVPEQNIDILVHRQSIVHSMVEFEDGAILAQLGVPDMRVPIAYALTGSERVDFGAERLDLRRLASLTFEAPDEETFPATKLARAAFRTGGTAPVIFNGANEAAVALFLAGRIGFLKITELIEGALEACAAEPLTGVESVFAADRQAREAVERLALRR